MEDSSTGGSTVGHDSDGSRSCSNDKGKSCSSEDTTLGDNVATVIPLEPCPLCGQVPCDWIAFGEEISEECDELMEQQRPTKESRFHAYRLYTRLRFGVLRKYDRRPLPVCVRGEIMDSYPDPNHQYVGFLAAMNDVSSDD